MIQKYILQAAAKGVKIVFHTIPGVKQFGSAN